MKNAIFSICFTYSVLLSSVFGIPVLDDAQNKSQLSLCEISNNYQDLNDSYSQYYYYELSDDMCGINTNKEKQVIEGFPAHIQDASFSNISNGANDDPLWEDVSVGANDDPLWGSNFKENDSEVFGKELDKDGKRFSKKRKVSEIDQEDISKANKKRKGKEQAVDDEEIEQTMNNKNGKQESYSIATVLFDYYMQQRISSTSESIVDPTNFDSVSKRSKYNPDPTSSTR